MTVYQIARSERASDNLLTALSRIEAVLNHIEAQRGKINNQELRASYFASQRELFEFDISLLMQLHKQQPLEGHDASALQVCERARARSLLELLTEAHANIRQDIGGPHTFITSAGGRQIIKRAWPGVSSYLLRADAQPLPRASQRPVWRRRAAGEYRPSRS